MNGLYPDIEPLETGQLAVGDGHRLYWEVCGHPAGKPVVVLHGGPGSGCTPGHRRFFDPSAYRIVLFDQRGCGRSVPQAGDFSVDLSSNTTHHLIADLERLRTHLGIDRWMVFGGSWGSTLGLAYAQRYPERVTEMVLAGVTMTRPSEIRWLYRTVAPLFPEAWARFRAGVPEAERDGDLVEAYYRLLRHPDAAVRERAVQDWCDWETSLESVDPNHRASARRLTPEFRRTFARLVTHYFYHRAWLEDGELLRNAHRLAGIPGILVQGRLDLAGPLVTAWELARAWPDAELVIVRNAGHTTSDPGMPESIIAATDRFAHSGTG
ncbi:MAG: prolyl aminopeptidase [Capsulimonadales bacterium]|nr:prolyl aminopeptidase [Capsulimonadales bacterium]